MLHQRASDPAARQGRHPQDQGGARCHLAPSQIGAGIGHRQQGHRQEGQGHGFPGGQPGGADQQGQQQDRSAGPEHRQQEADQGAPAGHQQQNGGAQARTRFQGITASRRAMPQKPLMPAKLRPAPTKPLSQIQPGATVWLSSTPTSTRPPATICT